MRLEKWNAGDREGRLDVMLPFNSRGWGGVAVGMSVFFGKVCCSSVFDQERSIEWCPTGVAWVLERATGMVVRAEEVFRRNRWDCWRVGSIVTEGFPWI